MIIITTQKLTYYKALCLSGVCVSVCLCGGGVVSRIISGENTTGNITQVSVLPTFILLFFFKGT